MKNKLLFAAAAVTAAVLLTLVTSWRELSRLDYGKVFTRAAWQFPDRVVDALEIAPGSHVADVGAGDGYFTFRLADAVGPNGKVYAVEVEEGKVRRLERAVRREGTSNVEVVLGEYGDPLLPDGAVDLVFVCNTYHHIGGQIEYFSRLQADLRPGGRVALLEPLDGLKGLAGVLSPPGHSTPPEVMRQEMDAAGYAHRRSFEFLPVQSFEVFAPR